MVSNQNGTDDQTTPRRRTFLKASGAAGAAGLASLAGCLGVFGGGGGSKTIRAFVWEGYGPVIKEFEKQHDITVKTELATTSNAMLTKANSAPERYDMVAPNSGFIVRFQEAGLVQPIAKSKNQMLNEVPNFENTYDYFRQGVIKDHLTDKQNRWYGIPPRFGLYGLAFDKRKVKPSQLQSSADIWNNKELWQKSGVGIGVNKDPIHSITHAVRALGYGDMLRKNDKFKVTGKAWEETREKFLELADFTRALFGSETQLARSLTANSYNTVVGPGRNDIINLVKKGKKNFEYTNPKEGALGWTEGFLMMKSSDAKEEVKKLMNFFLKPKMGALLATSDLAPSTVKKSKKYLSDKQVDLFWVPPKAVKESIQAKPYAEPQKWKQLMNEFQTKL